jgi:hypothetical protein
MSVQRARSAREAERALRDLGTKTGGNESDEPKYLCEEDDNQNPDQFVHPRSLSPGQ